SLPAALQKIVSALAANGKITDAPRFLEELLAREQKNPSLVAYGTAFPHARTELVNEIVLGIGRSQAGIPMADGQRAHLLFVIGVPQRLVNDYLICVGALVRVIKGDKVRRALMRARTPADFVDTLRAALAETT